ncbi:MULTISPECIES: protease complex subunit PrcB family protein [Flavobacterium]|uniref:Protease complex subunit PrcB family protein n=1 Tax=Flavobacterium ranwuense TaxID=2541725 RepID=A0ABY2DQK3_9FLAO|nr:MULTISPECIES: protease complex subunit PrcB family protein [Flavobacterium]TDE28314.1 protease complex subunit PrcB family protein [Flavobacterium ranwuense]TDE52597.1 protease complex subunit PrcB family protein [Flavobacterium sp. GT3P67]
MKKIVLSLVALTLVSCGATSSKSSDKNSLYEVLTQQTNGGASIRFFEILSEPNEIAMLQNDENLKNKIGPNDIQTSNFIVLNMGEKTSGGYSIGIDTVVETDKNIVITIKETIPEPGSMVTQAFTNPFCVVKINSKKEIIFK